MILIMIKTFLNARSRKSMFLVFFIVPILSLLIFNIASAADVYRVDRYQRGLEYIDEGKPFRASAEFSRYLQEKKVESIDPAQRFVIAQNFFETEKLYMARRLMIGLKADDLFKSPTTKQEKLNELYFQYIKNGSKRGYALLEKMINEATTPEEEAELRVIKFRFFLRYEKYNLAFKELERVQELTSDFELWLIDSNSSLPPKALYFHNGMVEQIVIDPANPPNKSIPFYIQLVSIYEKNGLQDNLFEFYKKMIEIDPDYLPAYTSLAALYNESDEHKKAYEYYKMALEIDPFSHVAQNGAGYTLLIQDKDPKAAITHLKIALKTDPQNPHVHNNLGLLYLNSYKNQHRAISHFKQSIRYNHPYLDRPNFNLARAYRLQKDYKNAERYLLNALAFDPENMLFMQEFIRLVDEQGFGGNSHIDLVEHYRSIISRKTVPDVLALYDVVMFTYKQNGKYEIVRNLSELALSLDLNTYDPVNVSSIYLLTGLTYHKTDFDKAFSYYKNSLKWNSENVLTHHNIGRLYFSRGRYEEALPYFQHAYKLDPGPGSTEQLLRQTEKILKIPATSHPYPQ